MASFKESLASAEISTSNYSVSTLAEETEIDETWIRSDKYLWYDEYSDNNLSTIDELKNIFVNDKQINVTQETNAQYIPFRMPRYYDGVDLTSMNILIHYVTAGGYEDYSTPINVSYSSAKIQFAWLVPKNATVHSGDLSFEIHVTGSNSKGDEYLYKTRPNGKLNIIKSLEGNGVIEPDNSWITSFLKQVNEKVSEATTAANEAKAAAQDALEAAESVNSQVDNITLTVTNKIVTETLSGYYTKLEVDEIVSNIDYSDMLNEVQKKIDAIDGLANLAIEYNSSTNIMTFKNGEAVIASYVLNTNPTAEWTTSFRNSVKTDIDNAVKNVSDDLDSYKQTNDKAILDLQDDFDNLSSSTYTSEQIDEKLNEKANNSAISSMQQTIDQVKSTSDTNKSNISVVTNKLAEIEEKVNGINTDPSLSYYATYNAETGQYTLYEVNGDAESIKSQFTITGGGGGSTTSTTVKIDRITLSPVTATKNDKVLIKYNFSSIDSSGEDTGEGTATWKVGNTVVATTIAIQGENTFDATDYVSVGTQKITLTVTDAAGTIAVKTWTVQVVDVRIETSFNDKFTYPIGTVSFDYTPYGSIEKTVHFILDDVEIGTVTTTSSGIPMSYTIPQQAHGSHLLDAYITAELNGSTIETNHVYKDIIWYDESSNIPVIGCVYKNITAKQYDSTNIIYTVYDPKTETPKVALAVDGETVSTLTLNTSTNTWQYKSSDVGDHVLTITCGDTVKTINVTIEKLDIDVEPITANLAFDFNPSGRSNNNDADRLWKYNDSIAMTVSDNFDWVNGGYQMDDNGDQYFCVKAGTSAVISYNLFADDARKNGKEFKIVFKSTNVRKSNATFLRCMANSIGLKMNVHEAYVSSSAANLYSPYSEEDIIEWEFNICKDSDIPLVMTYEDGTNFRPMIYTSDHSFTQTSPSEITIGSADCDVWIYRMKAYSSNLTYSGIIQNFIADGRSADEIIKRYNRNQIYDENNFLNPDVLAEKCPQLHILKVDCPHWTNDKKDFVKNTSAQCIYKNGDFVLDNWKATNIYHSGQGTTSNEYGQAARNFDLLMCFDGVYQNSKITYDPDYLTQITFGDGTVYSNGEGKIALSRNSVPINIINVKVNVASSEMENNRLLQKRYNDYLPYKTPAMKRDSRVKNSMEFVNCVVFIRENDEDLTTHREFQDTDWHFYSLGNMGDSKKTDNTRVCDANDPKEFCVEIMDNTLPNSTFSGTEEALAALDADTFNEKGTYGFRYEMDGITDEQRQANIQTWRDFYRFVALSSDEDFVSKLSDWFIVDSATYFYLFTERFSMTDNRAKNTFWHFFKNYITQEEAEAMGDAAQYYEIDDEAAAINNGYRYELWNYDNDTALGINNSGELTLTYGKEDVDYRTDDDPSSGYIFNAATSVFFCRIRDLMYDQLQAMYVNRESAGAWSNLIPEFNAAQEEFPEELWRLQYERLYERTYREGTSRFLVSMSNGKKKYQRRQFERDQEPYFGTKYFGTNITSDQIMFRCNTPVDAVVTPDYTLHLTPYSDMYLAVMFGATYRTKIRAKAGVQYDIPCPFETMDDTAVLIYCASRIQSMGDLSACYIHDNDFSKATKLQVLTIGNATEGYSNVFLTNLVIGNNVLLEYLDIRNTPNLSASLNLSGCPNLTELYAEGSGLTGVVFANGGKLQISHLPAITSLTAKNLSYITDLQISAFDNMRTLIVENTPAIDTYSYVNDSINLANLRLIGIDWGTDEGIKDTTILDRLIKLAGIDNLGYNTQVSVLAGKFYSPSVKQKLLAEYMAAWPDLTINYDTLVTQFTVTFVNEDGTVLDVQYVDKGGSAVDPLTRENNPIDTPTKESTVSTDFTFSSWDSSLDNVFANRTITAQYSESVRQYTVKYVARSYVLQETKADYSSYVGYTGDIPTYTDEESAYVFYLFKNWDKSGYVDGDKIINAVYDRFEYTDGSLDNLDISEMTEVQIYAMMKLGKESELVSIKDSITFTMGYDYSYEDIQEKVLINDKTIFSGTNYIDTGIKLLDEDKDWTLAIDYRFSEGNSTGAVLMQCYQSDGSNGFKLWNSSNPRITWGTASTSSAGVSKRDMAVLRHIKGETVIHVYKGNIPAESIDYTTLNSTRVIAQNQTLVFGCSRADDGAYENYAKGTIYWCKLWYSDLGDDACRKLVAWTHESITSEMGGYKRYYLSDGSGKRCGLTFMTSHTLTNSMPLNSSTSNSGGWAEYSLNRFLNNRFYSALPVTWKQIIKQVKIPSTIGNKSTEITTSNCYIAIPSVIEVDASFQREPYTFEGETFSFITSDASRVRKNPDNEDVEYWLRSPNKDYENYIFSISASGSTEGYSYGLYNKNIVIIFSI